MNIDLKRLRNDATLVATEHRTFESRLDLQTFLHQLALQYNKEFTVAPNNNKTRYEVRCTAAECPFKIIARAPIDSEVWCITKAVTHAAGCVASPKTYFPPKIIAYILKEDFRCERPFSPKALEKSSSVIKNGTSAARTIRAAQNYLYGDRESSYRLLPYYFSAICEKMPGSVAFVNFNAEGHFHRCFFSLEASSEGFEYTKPLLGLDGCHIKTQYLGVLLVATTVDAAGHTFPLAFGVVENEHYDSWKWFIEELKKVFDLTGITVISDRQKGLIKAVGETLQTSAHAFCVKHLADNANGKGSKKARPFIFRLAKCGSKVEYEKLLREMTLVSPAAANYIRNTAEPHHWVEYQFPGNRCGHVTSNIVECVNACIAEARQLPIVHMLESIRSMLARWFITRRTEARNLSSTIVCRANDILEQRLLQSRDLKAVELDQAKFEVRENGTVFTVNVDSNECSCGALEKKGFRSRGVELCSELHSTQRFLKTYSGRILSVDDIKLHSVVKQTLEDKIESDIQTQPPIPTPRAGRPGVVRKRRSNEPRGPNSRSEKFTDAVEPAPKQRRKYTCKVCGVEGHNARGCPNKDKE
ncbi:hypothetical protein P9112_005418 [Eukaryota sp. TZLM1-RC]